MEVNSLWYFTQKRCHVHAKAFEENNFTTQAASKELPLVRYYLLFAELDQALPHSKQQRNNSSLTQRMLW